MFVDFAVFFDLLLNFVVEFWGRMKEQWRNDD